MDRKEDKMCAMDVINAREIGRDVCLLNSAINRAQDCLDILRDMANDCTVESPDQREIDLLDGQICAMKAYMRFLLERKNLAENG